MENIFITQTTAQNKAVKTPLASKQIDYESVYDIACTVQLIRYLEPLIEIDGTREPPVKLTSPPPIYKTVNFFTGKYYNRADKIADADLRNIVYKTSCV